MSNPLQKLINRYLSENQLSKSEFIQQLGYTYINTRWQKLICFYWKSWW